MPLPGTGRGCHWYGIRSAFCDVQKQKGKIMAKEKKKELMEGYCKGCGQMILVEADAAALADTEATKKCKCEQSRIFRSVADMLFTIAKMCLHDEIAQAQVKVEDSTITITRKTASVGINRTMKVEIGEEAQE